MYHYFKLVLTNGFSSAAKTDTSMMVDFCVSSTFSTREMKMRPWSRSKRSLSHTAPSAFVFDRGNWQLHQRILLIVVFIPTVGLEPQTMSPSPAPRTVRSTHRKRLRKLFGMTIYCNMKPTIGPRSSTLLTRLGKLYSFGHTRLSSLIEKDNKKQILSKISQDDESLSGRQGEIHTNPFDSIRCSHRQQTLHPL